MIELPEPLSVMKWQHNMYTLAQMQAYGEALRRETLEEVADEVDEYTTNTYGATYGVGDFIRKYLK